MPNDFFQFKQFKVVQKALGMKVTTDACVFGALLADVLPAHPIKVLDIGAGTGLLSLMVAQLHSSARITAVEIDEEASLQAQENCHQSPWADRISVVHQAIQDFHKTAQQSYDLIVANPPFYTSHHQSQNSKKALAHHTNSLSQHDLAQAVESLLTADGLFTVLLPAFESAQLQDLLESHAIVLRKSVRIYNREGDDRIFRIINSYSRVEGVEQEERFDIRTAENDYSPDFVRYLFPFYLHLIM